MTDVVTVQDVSVAYKFYEKPSHMLREAVFGGSHHETFWALRDVSLRVREGERLGIIGPNGAGKTTLLKVISGNLLQTSGKVSVTGSISSLLSMVPAWNVEASGIENIRYNLLLQGIAERRIPLLIEDIAEFTELGGFLFNPVKTYSSGMGARLSFGIATATDPEILIVDEVLGVGDGYFAAKAARRMQEFCARGKALLFVSHSTSAVQQMCDRAIWLDQGAVRMDGDVAAVLKAYELDFRAAEDLKIRSHEIDASKARADQPFRSAGGSGGLRFRIVPNEQVQVGGTHFIRSIKVSGLSTEILEVPLMDRGEDDSKPGLDVFDSEWGRLSEHRGSVCRQLANNSARLRGGHFAVPSPVVRQDGQTSVVIEVESDSARTSAGIVLEYYDFLRGAWEKANLVGSQLEPPDWTRSQFEIPTEKLSPSNGELDFRPADLQKPAVSIEKVELVSESGDTRIIAERQPFEVRIGLTHREVVDAVDVGLKITRTDGAYVFWQSSGLVGQSVRRRSPGGSVCIFKFDKNIFGAGEYTITVILGNEWSYPDNYPYSRIYHRAIDILRFRITRELESVDFGVVNVRVPVEVEFVD